MHLTLFTEHVYCMQGLTLSVVNLPNFTELSVLAIEIALFTSQGGLPEFLSTAKDKFMPSERVLKNIKISCGIMLHPRLHSPHSKEFFLVFENYVELCVHPLLLEPRVFNRCKCCRTSKRFQTKVKVNLQPSVVHTIQSCGHVDSKTRTKVLLF